MNIASAVCTTVGSAYGSLRGSKCFIAGTLVQTEDGLKPIEQIEVGDLVLAYDEDTGKQAYKKVVRLFRNSTEEWYHIYANGEEIICTGGHPFYVLNAGNNRTYIEFEGNKANANGKWVMAKDLQIGDNLLLSDNTCAIIEEIKVESLSKPETTYNFEVEDYHTYYVTESKVLVHNMCKTNTPSQSDNPLEDIEYTDKVKTQMEMGDNHSFPKEVDNYGSLGKQTQFTGGDSKTYTKLTIDGAYKGHNGYFEYIYDANKVCNHRLFRRY